MFSTKGRYALRVMLELAQYPEGESVPLMVVAESQEISEKYLESIIVIESFAISDVSSEVTTAFLIPSLSKFSTTIFARFGTYSFE